MMFGKNPLKDKQGGPIVPGQFDVR